MRGITDKLEIGIIEAVNIFNIRVQSHERRGKGLSGELGIDLIEVVEIDMEIPEGVNKFLGLEVTDLGNHKRENGVRSDIEGNAKEEVSTTLVKLAAEFSIFGDMKLEHGVAGRESHLVDFAWIPSNDNMTATVGIRFNLMDKIIDLVGGFAVGRAPIPPLSPIDTAKVTVFIGPLIPDGDFMVVKVFYIGIAFKEPKQFIDNGFEVNLLSGEEREGLREVKAGLSTEDAKGADTCAVFALMSVI